MPYDPNYHLNQDGPVDRYTPPDQREPNLLERLRAAINSELPRTHKGFRCQYEQDAVMRALDRAFAKVRAAVETFDECDHDWRSGPPGCGEMCNKCGSKR